MHAFRSAYQEAVNLTNTTTVNPVVNSHHINGCFQPIIVSYKSYSSTRVGIDNQVCLHNSTTECFISFKVDMKRKFLFSDLKVQEKLERTPLTIS